MDVVPSLHAWLLSLDQSVSGSLGFKQLLMFINLASHLKREILLTQPAGQNPSVAPYALPPAVTTFLGTATSIPIGFIPDLWFRLREFIWNRVGSTEPLEELPEDEHDRMLTCIRYGQPVEIACAINYHHNYSVHEGSRTYYDNIPSILQIGEHQFAETRLINSWINLMLVAWVSASNCANHYNATMFKHKGRNLLKETGWQFQTTMTHELVYDAFTLLSLLEDCQRREQHLILPHTGTQYERMKKAVDDVNTRRRYVHPYLNHSCDLCTRRYDDKGLKVTAVVIDGITLGHPCCAVYNCKVDLEKTTHRYCPQHRHMDRECMIVGCTSQRAAGSKACSDDRHREVIEIYELRGTARFQLQHQLKRSRVANPESSAPSSEADIQQTIQEGELELNALKVQGRARTHNEQIFNYPCGIIIGRESFFGAEGPGAVIEATKRIFRHGLPEHILFDNNCTLKKMVKDDPDFANVGLTVDVFHFKCKHSQLDTFCQEHCNPESYPELKKEGGKGWFFNSSIAEQTNVWLGGYHAICRTMSAARYNFFLDEMIERRNRNTISKLRAMGAHPITIDRNL
ncbi:hypothetical protein CC1G_15062 [Coprinopsis cinerea okayama7|uniref:CxC6 like cysteine cluster associated with KDZ domain-containing protein n=1 Tax=Coprinopsis cinerea (strain Okayama-7 / 130 / ATCC MYA-4618 / FGSC 9003) TaxID=240176 RepID=D6RP76_COPC7|nr:hypothetical protein CC1G_15062 [Coprinopsis cinerea okayama7\|eukprot:XP_002910728.1 hypothetical protein CC1G_15062 [Coprinopsis cinerea okayama7\